MELKPGMKVKLVPWEEADDESPGINTDMKPFFGTVVTVKRREKRASYDTFFRIEEDSHIYDERWVESRNLMPDELFEI